MKKQRNLLLSMLALLVILTGAYVLYNNLSKTYAPGSNLSAMPGADDSEILSSGETDVLNPEPSAEASDTVSAPDKTKNESETEPDEETAADESSEQEKYAAPDFTVYDLGGTPHKLSDYAGKPVVLNFWASWCGPCKSEMPEFDEAYARYGENVNFLIVNLTDGSSETVESASSYIDKNGYTFPVYYDTDIDAAMKYGVTSIPATYFIDAEGYLAAYGIGALDGATLEKGIGMIYTAE